MSNDDDFFLDGDCENSVAQTPTPRIAPTVSRGNDKATVPFYFDLETTVDESRLESFGLEPVPPVPEPVAWETLPEPSSIIDGTADDVKARLQKIGIVDFKWLDLLTSAELAGKSRKGVLDLIKQAGQRRQEALDAHADRIKLLSTTPEYLSICAIGIAVGNEPVRSYVVGEVMENTIGEATVVTEQGILEAFWAMLEWATTKPLVGYHILGFDIPAILARSAILDIPTTRMIDTSPWGSDVCDLYLKRFGARGNASRERPGKLKELAPLYGIDVPAGDCDGSQVYELMKTPEGRVKVGEYVRSDVHVLREWHRKCAGYFWA